MDNALAEIGEEKSELATAGSARLFKWADVAPEERPWRSFEEEFFKSPDLLSAKTQVYRWCNSGRYPFEPVEPRTIYLFHNHPFREVDRQLAQAKILEDMGFDASKPEFKRAINNLRTARLLHRIGRIEQILDDGEITDQLMHDVITRDEDGKETTHKELSTHVRPLKPREIAQLQQRVEEMDKLLRLLTEQATEINEVVATVRKPESSLNVSMIISDPNSAQAACLLTEQIVNASEGRLTDGTERTQSETNSEADAFGVRALGDGR